MRVGRRLVTGVFTAGLLVGVGLLTACGGSSNSSSGNANVRLLNATSGYASLDLALDTKAVNTAVLFGAAGSYGSAASSGVATVITATGSPAALSTVSRTLTKDAHYTLIAYGSPGALVTRVIQENTAAPASGLTSLQVINLAPDAGTVDVYLTGSADTLDGATPVASALAAGSSLPFTNFTSSTYRLRVTGAGSKTDVRLDASGVVLDSAKVVTLVLSNGVGGVLVNSALLVQQGAATALANTQARVRVIAAVTKGATVTATVGSTTVASAVTSPNIAGTYTQVPASTNAPLTVTVNGVAKSLAGQVIAAGGDYTLLVNGNAANPTLALLTDDNRYPTVSGNAKVRLFNVTSGAAATYSLKSDFSAVADAVAQGQASAFVNLAASTTTTVRMDVNDAANVSLTPVTTGYPVTLAAKGVYTMYVVGDSGAPGFAFSKER